MPTTPVDLRQLTVLEQHECDTWDALIGEQVLHLLGEPEGLHLVQVRPLWKDHYRVNVLTGDDAISIRIANSYFVEADRDGNIVASSPAITKQY